MKYIIMIIFLSLPGIITAGCEEECKKIEDSCKKFATKMPSYAQPGSCQARYNRCFLFCRTIAPFVAKKADQRKNSAAA